MEMFDCKGGMRLVYVWNRKTRCIATFHLKCSRVAQNHLGGPNTKKKTTLGTIRGSTCSGSIVALQNDIYVLHT